MSSISKAFLTTRFDLERGIGYRMHNGSENLPRDSLLPFSIPLLVVGRVVLDWELCVGAITAYSTVGHC